jgi:hypothetical protein
MRTAVNVRRRDLNIEKIRRTVNPSPLGKVRFYESSPMMMW